MSKYYYDENRCLHAYDVDIPRGGKNLKNFFLSLPTNEDFSKWSPDRWQNEFVRLCGANSLFDAQTQAKRDQLEGKAIPITAVERLALEGKLKRQKYFLGEDIFPHAQTEQEPEKFSALFEPEFVKRFPYRWRHMACDQLSVESLFFYRNRQDTVLDIVVGEGAEEIVRASRTNWGDTGQLIDFRKADAWQQMEQFGQKGAGFNAKTVGILGVREMLKNGAADAFIADLVAYAQSHKHVCIILAAHRKDKQFFVDTKPDAIQFDSVTVHNLDKMTENLQWSTTYTPKK